MDIVLRVGRTFGYETLAHAITNITVRWLDVILTCADVLTDVTYSDRILHDALYENESIHNKGYSHICKLYKLFEDYAYDAMEVQWGLWA